MNLLRLNHNNELDVECTPLSSLDILHAIFVPEVEFISRVEVGADEGFPVSHFESPVRDVRRPFYLNVEDGVDGLGFEIIV
jgi:hypothetical protein